MVRGVVIHFPLLIQTIKKGDTHMTEENEVRQETQKNQVTITKVIDNTTYEVVIHFSETSTETMEDKIKRMMKNDVLHGKY